jgi:prepilin-type processing-associated H-X9-DG protein/prepilin-type N-terminal cleavage/methylation domain-containing protein
MSGGVVLRMRRRAFTLIEMMVVLATITVLVALLLPALGRARSVAQMAVCASNLRQMGTATQMYLGQWNYYPGNAATLSNGQSFSIWQPRLMLFMAHNPAVFYCPAEPISEEWWNTFASARNSRSLWVNATSGEMGYGYIPGEELFSIPQYSADGEYANFSYGYNVWGTEIGAHRQLGLGTGTYLVGKAHNAQPTSSEVVDPGDMIEITDREFFLKPQYPYAYEVWPSRPDLNPPSDVHNGGSNVLFCDGHVATLLQTRLTTLKLGLSPDAIPNNMMWNIDHRYHKPF